MMTLPNQTDLDRRYDEYRTLCYLEGMLPVGFATWLEWDRDVYLPHVKTAATPLSPATHQKLYGTKIMDEQNKKDNLSLIITYQDRVALLEEQLRVTEAELKTRDSRISVLEETVQQYRDSETANKERVRSLELLNDDRLCTITALEHALQDVGEANTSLRAKLDKSDIDCSNRIMKIGEQAAKYLQEITGLKEELEKARRGEHSTDFLQSLETLSEEAHDHYKSQLAAKDKEIERLKNTAHAKYRPTLTTFEEMALNQAYPAAFRCLPQDIRVGDMLADGRDEWQVTNVVPENDGFRIECSTDFIRFCPNEPVCLHSLALEGVPYDNLVDKTALEEAKKLIAKLTEQLDQQKISAARKTPANAVKYPHYFREVTNTTHVDVSWFLKAFNIPCCEGHAIKKLLVSGQRGAKNRMQDLKEARDSIDRAIEMEEESQ